MFKKAILVLISLTMLFSTPILAQGEISVYYDGSIVDFDVKPQVSEGRTMVPLRGIFEKMGAVVAWNENSKTASVVYGETEILLTPSFSAAIVNGEAKTLDAAPCISEGRILVPLRFISESMGCKVEYDDTSKKVEIGRAPKKEIPSFNVINVTAKTHDGNLPENSCDGDYDTRWSAEGKDMWIIYELEEMQVVSHCGVAWYYGNERLANFDLYISKDGETWEKTFSGQQPDFSLNMAAYPLGGKEAKFIKLVGNGNSSNTWNSITEIKFYGPQNGGEMLVEDAGFGSVGDKIKPTDEIIEALKQFDTLYGKNILQWLIDIYDPETGAFHYTKSGADHKGFLPDVESTRFAISIMQSGGLVDDTLPDWWAQKLGSWVQQNQSNDDGYFYHKQWGKTSGSRRDRDLMYSQAVLKTCNMLPLYPTAAERMSEAVAGGNTSATAPAYLQSEKAFIEYLDSMDWSTKGIWATGNSLASGSSMISASGLKGVLMEYLNEKQNKELGLWGDDLTGMESLQYNNLNGAMKIAGLYNQSYPYPNIDKLLDSTIYVLGNVELPENAQPTYIWNPISALQSAISSHVDVGDEFNKKLIDNALLFINKTFEATARFKQEDGGFSSNPGLGLSVIQGSAPVGLGLCESDMDATVIVSQRLRASLYNLFGATPDNEFYKPYAEWFFDEIKNKEPIKKKGVESFFDFEKDKVGGKAKGWSLGSGYLVADDPAKPGKNKCLMFSKTGNPTPQATFQATPPDVWKTAVYECDIMLDNPGPQDLMYCTFGSTGFGQGAVQWIVGAGNTLGYRTAGNVTATKFDVVFEDGLWYNFKIEYTPIGVNTSEVRFYIDNQLVLNTNRIYLGNKGTETKAFTDINGANFTPFSSGKGAFYLDNVKVTFR